MMTQPTRRDGSIEANKKNKNASPKKKKRHQQKERAGTRVIVEPFDIQLPKEFKESNNTRKVHYPMMLKKYNHEKIQAWDLHDFRRAMLQIVRKDNDDMFSENLAKKSGRTLAKRDD